MKITPKYCYYVELRPVNLSRVNALLWLAIAVGAGAVLYLVGGSDTVISSVVTAAAVATSIS